jgi:pyruvate/2-oxoglutarate/acetoin dehydrogenase E1 component
VFEQKNLYTRIRGALDFEHQAVVAGARVVREGTDLTLLSNGAALHLTVEACATLESAGVDPEVIDLRVLRPLDWETVFASVRKTSRCLVVSEDYEEYGVASEIAARLASELFTELDAPIARVGAGFWPIPFSPPLEEATLPSTERIVRVAKELAAF